MFGLAWFSLLGTVSMQPDARFAVRTGAGIPVAFARVSVVGGATRIADSMGNAFFDAALDDSVRVQVRRVGFAPADAWVARGRDGIFLVELEPIATKLETVTVRATVETPLARTGFYERLQQVQYGAVLGEFITPEDLDARDPGQVSRMLLGKRYVTVQQSRRGRVGSMELRGRGGCLMTIVLDGRRMDDTNPDDIVSGRDVMAIEIYPSTANAPIGMVPLTGRGSCGIVAIWTGPRR